MNPIDALGEIVNLGGPVIAILLVISVLTLGVALYKIWQFAVSGVGRHRHLSEALAAWDAGDRQTARTRLAESRSYLAPLLKVAMEERDMPGLDDRLDAEAGLALAGLERGFRFLDTVAQLAPLLGLFGTVLGMIEAFQSLQNAGSSVDPSLLAGGIWVALLTTAVGLAVAMPTSMVLAWLESRTAGERVFADKALRTVAVPSRTDPADAAPDFAPLASNHG
ncbi:outer membrane transport energization protein ExbB [Aliiruegeria haliotis]|uniref:Outer membrane transport energization protein ExbB n=1 Tax=Aliiruegeria haliotis TaxID=1280846 RepID=A0A2T0RPM7_9RHOB|nr:MotA/TolQ/ExbB proton channel family protein [Aliiruegeria haliotis]PRY23139.1 outer membrane transport energization protein ExbB [Aliiruegeria haliotis]